MARKKDNRALLLLGLAGVAYWAFRPKAALAHDAPQLDPRPYIATPVLPGSGAHAIPAGNGAVVVKPGTGPGYGPGGTGPGSGPPTGPFAHLDPLDPVDWSDQEPIPGYEAPPATSNGQPEGNVVPCEPFGIAAPGDTPAPGCALVPMLPPPFHFMIGSPFPIPTPLPGAWSIPIPGGAGGRGGLNLA